METSNEPIEITHVEAASVSDVSFIVNITLSDEKSPEERVYLRYTTDDWSSSRHVLATGSGTSYTAAAPKENMSYYILTTTVDLGENGTTYANDYDLVTMRLNNNEGTNYHVNFYDAQLTGAEGFRMLSTPVGVTYSDFLAPIWTQGAIGSDSPANGEPNVFVWNAEAEGTVEENWDGLTDLSAATTPGEGFLVYVYEDDNYSEEGGTDWPKTLFVSGTEHGDGISPDMNASSGGWTLVGNPYASTIDFNKIDKTGLTNAAYVWNPESGNWMTYAHVGDAIEGAGDLNGGLIAPFQGFFVQTAVGGTPSLTFNTSAKASGGTFYGKQVSQERAVVRLQAEGHGLSSSAWLQFSEAGSDTEPVRGDALKLESLSAQFAQLAFSKQVSPLLDIVHMPIQDGNYELPVHFTATASGNYSISASQFQVPAGLKLTFHDYEKGVAIPVDENFTYSFNFELPQAAKAADVPLLKKLTQAPLVAKSNGETTRFGITISAGLGVKNEAPHGSPAGFALAQNYPNPFNPSTVIGYQLPQNGHVRLEVYDMLGQKVATLVDGVVTAGTHQVTFDGRELSSGVYIYRLSAGSQVFTKKLTLIK